MITRSDNPPLTTEQVAARRRLLVIAGIVVIFAAGYYLFALHAAADRDARRKPIQAKINQLRAADHSFASINKGLARTWNSFEAELAAAGAASTARHDNSVGSNPSSETILAYAKKESAQIDAAIADFQTIKDAYARAQEIDEALLGADAVQKYRSDAQAYTTAEAIGLDDWSRGVAQIVDDYKIAIRDGDDVNSSDNSDIEHDYQMSDEQTTRADADFVPLAADISQMQNLRSSRLHQLKMDLAAIK
jgi:hypothetical protein